MCTPLEGNTSNDFVLSAKALVDLIQKRVSKLAQVGSFDLNLGPVHEEGEFLLERNQVVHADVVGEDSCHLVYQKRFIIMAVMMTSKVIAFIGYSVMPKIKVI